MPHSRPGRWAVALANLQSRHQSLSIAFTEEKDKILDLAAELEATAHHRLVEAIDAAQSRLAPLIASMDFTPLLSIRDEYTDWEPKAESTRDRLDTLMALDLEPDLVFDPQFTAQVTVDELDYLTDVLTPVMDELEEVEFPLGFGRD